VAETCKLLFDDGTIIRTYEFVVRRGPLRPNDEEQWNMTGGTGW